MADRSNADIIRIVEKWQNAGFIHELTCGMDSSHLPLAPIELEGKVVLLCPTCKWVQDEVPAVVLGSEAVIDYNAQLMASSVFDDRKKALRQDLWFGVAVTMCIATILPALVGGALYAVGGGIIGLFVCVFLARRADGKIQRLDRVAEEHRDFHAPESPP